VVSNEGGYHKIAPFLFAVYFFMKGDLGGRWPISNINAHDGVIYVKSVIQSVMQSIRSSVIQGVHSYCRKLLNYIGKGVIQGVH